MAQAASGKMSKKTLDKYDLRHVQIVFVPHKSDAIKALAASEVAKSGKLGDRIVQPNFFPTSEFNIYQQSDGVQIFAAGDQLQVNIDLPSDQRVPLDGLRYIESRFKRFMRQASPIVGNEAQWLGMICTFSQRLSESKSMEDTTHEWLLEQGYSVSPDSKIIAFSRVMGVREAGWNCIRRLEGYQTHQGVIAAPTSGFIDAGTLPISESGIQFVTDVNDRSRGVRASVSKKMREAVELNINAAPGWLDDEIARLK